ncbi:MAG: hypothetical protein IJE07_02720 [Clostridia bacterium]|nr:hypothetical protein [Clostridia bacterium]
MKRVVRVMLLTLLAIVLLCVFYIAVVMGQPQQDAAGSQRSVREEQALPEPLDAPVMIADDAALGDVAAAFPAPVMYAAGKTLTFVSGACEDVPFEDGVARVVTLTYLTADFDTLTVQSIYPARALSLLEGEGRSFTGVTVDTLAGIRYVAMQDAATVRMHAQGEEALYVFTTPLAEYRVIDQWTNALQLYRPAE